MSQWTHRICERCWFDGPYGTLDDGAYRQPTQIIDPTPGPCCFCGGMTITGIFIRANPFSPPRDDTTSGVICAGDHEHPEQWSAVATRPTETP